MSIDEKMLAEPLLVSMTKTCEHVQPLSYKKGGRMKTYHSLVLLLASAFLHLAVPQLAFASGVMWIGAHPDDEATVGPFLAEYCKTGAFPCHMIVLTRGESGGCVDPPYCGGGPQQLAQIRSQEMLAVAQFYRSSLTQMSLPNLAYTSYYPAQQKLDLVSNTWLAYAGNLNNLVNPIRNQIRIRRPDVILTYDPRHGCTCHPEHRAAAILATYAAELEQVPADHIYMVEFDLVNYPPWAPQVKAGAPVNYWHDANHLIPGLNKTGWIIMKEGLALHRSQYTSATINLFNSTPSNLRKVPLAQATQANLANQSLVCQP
jgi:LmbE family N-acetylglucosaminyl deacetylase